MTIRFDETAAHPCAPPHSRDPRYALCPEIGPASPVELNTLSIHARNVENVKSDHCCVRNASIAGVSAAGRHTAGSST